FAHAEHGEDNLAGIEQLEQTLKDQRAERQYLATCLGEFLDTGKAAELLRLSQELTEGDRFGGGYRVAVRDMQRIARLLHVQPRNRTPRSPDGEERTAGAVGEPGDLRYRRVDHRLRFLD